MKQKLLLLLTMIFTFAYGFAQNRATAGEITVTDMNSVLFSNGNPDANSARIASAGTDENTINSNRLRSLVTQVQSSTYYYEGTERTFGSAPTNLYTDLSSLNQLNSAITQKAAIELVTIRINSASELNSTIDLGVFSSYPNLKYIYFITKLNTTSSGIASRIVNYDNRFNILYKIDKGDANQ